VTNTNSARMQYEGVFPMPWREALKRDARESRFFPPEKGLRRRQQPTGLSSLMAYSTCHWGIKACYLSLKYVLKDWRLNRYTVFPFLSCKAISLLTPLSMTWTSIHVQKLAATVYTSSCTLDRTFNQFFL
jgi:hypothetical protein